MEWTFPTPPALDGPTTGDERDLLTGYLRWQRRTLLNICAGLTGQQLVLRAVPSSGLTLLGLVRHLGKVERIWIRERFNEEVLPPMWGRAYSSDFDDVDPDRAADDLARVQQEWADCDAVSTGMSLDTEIVRGDTTMSLRFLHYHLFHEYSRHNGHADLIREAIDGVTGR